MGHTLCEGCRSLRGRRGLVQSPATAEGPTRVSGELTDMVLGPWDMSGLHQARL